MLYFVSYLQNNLRRKRNLLPIYLLVHLFIQSYTINYIYIFITGHCRLERLFTKTYSHNMLLEKIDE
jgi:hypothetical protein